MEKNKKEKILCWFPLIGIYFCVKHELLNKKYKNNYLFYTPINGNNYEFYGSALYHSVSLFIVSATIIKVFI